MRLRNVKGSKEFIANSPFVIQNPEELKGRWNTLFKNDNPIHIEIGMGKGKFIYKLASMFPDINFIGIEKYSSVLIRAINKQEEEPLPNLYFLRIDAEILTDIFEEDEINRIYLNFSDPWPKDRHAKRRLTAPGFLNLYNRVLSLDGRIEFKTDNRPLFDFSVDSFQKTEPWNLDLVTYDLHHSEYVEGNVMTEYEERFSSEGYQIHKLVATRTQK